jgi:hypothetical protein
MEAERTAMDKMERHIAHTPRPLLDLSAHHTQRLYIRNGPESNKSRYRLGLGGLTYGMGIGGPPPYVLTAVSLHVPRIGCQPVVIIAFFLICKPIR